MSDRIEHSTRSPALSYNFLRIQHNFPFTHVKHRFASFVVMTLHSCVFLSDGQKRSPCPGSGSDDHALTPSGKIPHVLVCYERGYLVKQKSL
jgi:hypothetical protein